MKKIISILFLLWPLFVFSQNKITLKSGESFVASIKGFYGKELVFLEEIPGANTNRLNIANVESIAGKISNSRMKAIRRKNPDVKFMAGDISKKEIKKQQSPIDQNSIHTNSPVVKLPLQLTAGDLIQNSARLRLTGFVIGTGVSTLFMAGVFNDLDSETQLGVATISGVAALGFYIAGEVTLIKAGKKMNQDAISISPAKNGIGVAINF